MIRKTFLPLFAAVVAVAALSAALYLFTPQQTADANSRANWPDVRTYGGLDTVLANGTAGHFVISTAQSISADRTATVSQYFEFLATGSVDQGAYTLTFCSPENINAPRRQQILTGTGAGIVRYSNAGEIQASWYGFSPSGTALSNAQAFTDIMEGVASGGGIILADAGTYPFSGVSIPAGVSIVGKGKGLTTFDHRGPDPCFTGTGKWLYQRFSDFTITHANNANADTDMIDARLGAKFCRFENIILMAKSAAITRNGIWIRAINPADSSVNANQFNNELISIIGDYIDSQGSGSCVFLDGDSQADARVNLNRMLFGMYDGFATGLTLEYGNLNTVYNVNFYSNGTAAIQINADSQTEGNTFQNCGFDSALPATIVGIDSDVIIHVGVFKDCVGLKNASQVTLTGDEADNVGFSIISRGSYQVGSIYGDTDFDGGDANVFGAVRDDQIVNFLGGFGGDSGGFVASGSAYTWEKQIVGQYGSASVRIKSGTGADFRLATTSDGNSYSKVFSLTETGHIKDLTSNAGGLGDRSIDIFQIDNGTNGESVSNTNVTAASIIGFYPLSAAAAMLMGSASYPWVASITPGASFIVQTADGNNVTADCQYRYWIVN